MDVQIYTKTDNTKKISHFMSDERYKALEENDLLNAAISKLPDNYNFEIYKSIIRVKEIKESINKKPRVALQFPDGFMIFSVLIADILENFAACECVILGDITYGACCIDDLGCRSLECDFLIHYGHSCLVPITDTVVKTMYVFVDIQIDVDHLVNTIAFNFEKSQAMFVLGSIQFNNSVFVCKRLLIEKGFTNVHIAQTKPRSNGEVLGCTSPNIDLKCDQSDAPVVIFICDGRFHMESAMIANPDLTFYQYNPFTKSLSLEEYDVELMKRIRQEMIDKCKRAKVIGIIFGILGRQGNPDILAGLERILKERGVRYHIILFSELVDDKLNKFEECECFVQIACTRISIDWGCYFTKPVITPYEAHVAWGKTEWKKNYPMDYYSYEGGEWSNYFNKKPKSYKK